MLIFYHILMSRVKNTLEAYLRSCPEPHGVYCDERVYALLDQLFTHSELVPLGVHSVIKLDPYAPGTPAPARPPSEPIMFLLFKWHDSFDSMLGKDPIYILILDRVVPSLPSPTTDLRYMAHAPYVQQLSRSVYGGITRHNISVLYNSVPTQHLKVTYCRHRPKVDKTVFSPILDGLPLKQGRESIFVHVECTDPIINSVHRWSYADLLNTYIDFTEEDLVYAARDPIYPKLAGMNYGEVSAHLRELLSGHQSKKITQQATVARNTQYIRRHIGYLEKLKAIIAKGNFMEISEENTGVLLGHKRDKGNPLSIFTAYMYPGQTSCYTGYSLRMTKIADGIQQAVTIYGESTYYFYLDTDRITWEEIMELENYIGDRDITILCRSMPKGMYISYVMPQKTLSCGLNLVVDHRFTPAAGSTGSAIAYSTGSAIVYGEVAEQIAEYRRESMLLFPDQEKLKEMETELTSRLHRELTQNSVKDSDTARVRLLKERKVLELKGHIRNYKRIQEHSGEMSLSETREDDEVQDQLYEGDLEALVREREVAAQELLRGIENIKEMTLDMALMITDGRSMLDRISDSIDSAETHIAGAATELNSAEGYQKSAFTWKKYLVGGTAVTGLMALIVGLKLRH